MYGEGPRRQEFDPEQLLKNLREGWEQFRNRLPKGGLGWIVGGFFGIIALIWLATGFYTVDAEEQAALRLFGEFRGTEGPGLHWYPPAPIGTRNVEAVLETKTMELGFRADGVSRDIPVEALMITGDLNIVDIQMVVQYRISDIEQFLFRVDDPGDPDRGLRIGQPDGRTLKDATEAALRQVVGQRGIDDVLTVAKEEVRDDTTQLLQEILDDYGAGIEVLSVVLQTVRPPDPVRQAFDDVVAARVNKEARINEARAFEQDRIPRAQGAAQQVVQGAQAFKQARIARAEGEAAQFLAILTEFQNSREVTRQRLFLEAMEEILPSISKFVIDPAAGGSQLQFLPLTPDGGFPSGSQEGS